MVSSKFYDAVRSNLFGGSLSQSQVSGLETIVSQAAARGVPLVHLAYILATAFHETAHTMQPIAEYGKGKGRSYGIPDGPYKLVYYGRGYVQLTWLKNYQKAGKAVGVDLVQFPERALAPAIAAPIMFDGMEEGWFTGKKLSDYLSSKSKDYVNARRIINGTDKADLIAGHASRFEAALVAGGYSSTEPAQTPPAANATIPAPKLASASPASSVAKVAVPAAVAVAGGAWTYWDKFQHWLTGWF